MKPQTVYVIVWKDSGEPICHGGSHYVCTSKKHAAQVCRWNPEGKHMEIVKSRLVPMKGKVGR